MSKDSVAGILLLAVAFVWCKKKCCCKQADTQVTMRESVQVSENKPATEALIKKDTQSQSVLAQADPSRQNVLFLLK